MTYRRNLTECHSTSLFDFCRNKNLVTSVRLQKGGGKYIRENFKSRKSNRITRKMLLISFLHILFKKHTRNHDLFYIAAYKQEKCIHFSYKLYDKIYIEVKQKEHSFFRHFIFKYTILKL